MSRLLHTEITGVVAQIHRKQDDVQGIYLFGSYARGVADRNSDVDLAVLLSPVASKQSISLVMSPLHDALQQFLKRSIDLLNLRQVSTVVQHQVISHGQLIDCQNRYAVEEFEMLVISFYQQLNFERSALLEAFADTGKAYAV